MNDFGLLIVNNQNSPIIHIVNAGSHPDAIVYIYTLEGTLAKGNIVHENINWLRHLYSTGHKVYINYVEVADIRDGYDSGPGAYVDIILKDGSRIRTYTTNSTEDKFSIGYYQSPSAS